MLIPWISQSGSSQASSRTCRKRSKVTSAIVGPPFWSEALRNAYRICDRRTAELRGDRGLLRVPSVLGAVEQLEHVRQIEVHGFRDRPEHVVVQIDVRHDLR